MVIDHGLKVGAELLRFCNQNGVGVCIEPFRKNINEGLREQRHPVGSCNLSDRAFPVQRLQRLDLSVNKEETVLIAERISDADPIGCLQQSRINIISGFGF